MRSGQRRRLALAVAVALLLAALSNPTAAGSGTLGIGLEWLSFHDERLDRLYGSPIAPAAEVQIWHGRNFGVRLGAAFASGDHAAGTLAYIDAAETAIRFVPISLRIHFRRPLTSRFQASVGPALAWAWFREEWTAQVATAGLTAQQTGTGSWVGIGGGAELAWRLERAGTLRAGFDWIWASAERLSIPGNDDQVSDMTGGWSSFRIGWEMPWLLW